ncbi:PREDICTED: lebercilin-like protein [Dufourea novaeangliae]|uniref:lebercilin-like protein n=1 Tax=Dufourea novaeangliae TaxID=178035 RepID=UPI00076720EE|nr:PREDICTED: lebercilin-like protein [Dufourea novaeangliae]
MQTEVPTLPVVQLNVNTNFNRTQNSNLKKLTEEAKPSLSHKNITCFSFNKKNLHPLIGQPYQNSVRQKASSEHLNLNKNGIKQRVQSAKMLRVKELQNQLADAHYQLNELANENRLLKSLQKRQDSALKRYEGTNAELPRIINSHHEELRIFHIKYKKLKALHKETCSLMKEKENELQQLQSQNKHLLQLSKDRNLGEREKLQSQISDLNYRIEQQQDTIQTLHRRLSLESKSLKQQLHIEISKRKETQKELEETKEKLKSLEHLLDNRERRLYRNGQLLLPTKIRHLSTQSLTNLRDISSSNPLKLSDQNGKWKSDVQEHSLPALDTFELNDKNIKVDERINLNKNSKYLKTETMTNLEQVRKYRLQKSAHRKILSGDFEEELQELDVKADKVNNYPERLEEHDENDKNPYKISAHKFRKIYENRKCQSFNELIKKETVYSSEDDESEGENENLHDNQIDVVSRSRESRIRFLNSANEAIGSDEFKLSTSKFENKLNDLAQDNKDSNKSDSEAESEVRKESIQHYFSSNHSNDVLKLISSVHDDQNHCTVDQEVEKLTISHFLNESQKMYENLINEMGTQTKNVENEDFYDLQHDVHINKEQVVANYSINKPSEDLQKYIVNQSISKEEKRGEGNTDDNRLPATNSFNATITLDKEQTSNVTYEKDTDSYNVETRNKLNKQEVNNVLKSVDISLSNVQSLDSDLTYNVTSKSDINTINENCARMKTISYNKEKLLATMKAIDDNENIEYLNQDYEKDNVKKNRKQITENLFRGLPTHMKKKEDIIKNIFNADGLQTEPAVYTKSSFHRLAVLISELTRKKNKQGSNKKEPVVHRRQWNEDTPRIRMP